MPENRKSNQPRFLTNTSSSLSDAWLDYKKRLSTSQRLRIITTIIILLAIPFTVFLGQQVVRYIIDAQTDTVDVFIAPDNVEINPSATVKVMANAKTNKLGFVRVDIVFDNSVVRLANEIQPSSLFTTVVEKTSRSDANSTGRATLVLGLSPDKRDVPPTGIFEVATLDLQSATSQSNVSSSISFNSRRMQIVNMSEEAAPINTIAGSLTINPTTSSPSPTVTTTPSDPVETIKVNFQPRGADTPSGYLPDIGVSYKSNFNHTYGWTQDNARGAVDRDSRFAEDQRYDTLVHFAHDSTGELLTWEIAVPNGNYDVFLVAGDPHYTDQTNNLNIEGTVVNDPDGQDNFDEYTVNVNVTDGRLTISTANGARNAKIAFIHITPEGVVSEPTATPTTGPTSSVSTPTPTPVSSTNTIRVNFQPSGSEIPNGYIPDTGVTYRTQSGKTFGWDQDNTGATRERNSSFAKDQRYDTLNHLQKRGDKSWEIALPNGDYNVFLVAGDPHFTNQINNISIEGVVMRDPDGEDEFDEYSTTVTVRDGRLTVSPASGASNAKVAFIDITPAGQAQPTATSTPRPTTTTSQSSPTPTVPVSSDEVIKVNFQPRGANTPSGYLPDVGVSYKSNFDHTYGWSQDNPGATRERNSAYAQDQRYDTLTHFAHETTGELLTWEMGVTNGTYEVLVVAGDPHFTDQVNNLNIEGTVVTDPDGEDHFDEYKRTVTVSDGRLTIRSAAGASNAKLAFLHIYPGGTGGTGDPGGTGLEVSNINAASGENYQLDTFRSGVRVYTDRNYTVVDSQDSPLPSSLENDVYIRTANDDKNSEGNSFLTFDVSRPVTVYIMFDIRADSLPSWMNGWTNTGFHVSTTDVDHKVYSRNFNAGTVTLGGNSTSGARSMYMVVVE